jgi:hypothetical protein
MKHIKHYNILNIKHNEHNEKYFKKIITNSVKIITVGMDKDLHLKVY